MARVRAYLAIAAGALALAVGLAIVLSERNPQRTGVNAVPPNAFVDSLLAHQTACQATSVPAQTHAIGLSVGVYRAAAPPLLLSLAVSGGKTRTAYVSGGYRGGELRISVPTIKREIAGASLCVENAGSGPVALAGVTTASDVSTLDGQGHMAALQISFYGPTTTGWALAPVLARRVGLLAFGGTGSWLLWVLVAVMIAAAAAAICLIAREGRR